MDLFSLAESAMGMNARSWARHANPLSAWSRLVGGTFVFLALWSYHWLGWRAAIPIAAALIWIWVNPRLFPPPRTARSWATQCVLGERAFLNRRRIEIPREHVRAGWITTLLAVPFMAICVYGFVAQEFWTAFAGWHGATLAKVWFCDRMVWLWRDVKGGHPTYRAWDRAEWTATLDD